MPAAWNCAGLIGSFLAMICASEVQAGVISACDTKPCAKGSSAETCGREIHWRSEKGNLYFVWDAHGQIISVRRDGFMALLTANETEQSQKISSFESNIENRFDADVLNGAFRDFLKSSFEEDLLNTKTVADKIATKIGSVCAANGAAPTSGRVIVASNPQQFAAGATLAGELLFCNRDFSVNYINSMSSDVIAKLRGVVQTLSDFDSMRKQPDGHHANQVNFYFDLTAGPGVAAVRLIVKPYTEFQFSDRGEQTFNSRVVSNCDLAEKAATELANFRD